MGTSGSLIAIIGGALAAARQMGLDRSEERDAALAVLLALDGSLTPGIARILVDQLFESGLAHVQQQLAA
jgi:hypothetical protein